jgi:hypothetical protein
MNPSSTDTHVPPTNGSDAVSRRAYELWEQEGRPEGCDLRHWLQAEQECRIKDPDQGVREVATSPLTQTTGTDRQHQGTRTIAPAREFKRGSNAPFGNEKPGGNGTVQSGGKRRSASSPAM